MKGEPDREVALTLLRSGNTVLYRKILPDHPELFDVIDRFAERVEILEDRVFELESKVEEEP